MTLKPRGPSSIPCVRAIMSMSRVRFSVHAVSIAQKFALFNTQIWRLTLKIIGVHSHDFFTRGLHFRCKKSLADRNLKNHDIIHKCSYTIVYKVHEATDQQHFREKKPITLMTNVCKMLRLKRLV